MPENGLCPVKHPACPCTEAKGVCPVCDWNHDVLFSSEAARACAQEAQQCVMRGLTALAAGQKAVAFAELAQALTISPALQLPTRLAPEYCDRAEAYQDQKQYEQALADYTQAIACDPENIKAYFNRGLVYEDLGEFDAIADYSQVIARAPDHTDAYVRRGRMYHFIHEYDKAIADYTQAIACDPAETEAYHKRADTYEAMGRVWEAEADRAKAASLSDK